MIDNTVKQLIMDAVAEVDHQKIILFGSHASGMATPESDYDLMLVVKKNLPVSDKISISTRLRRKLAEHLIDADIIIKSVAEVEFLKSKIGSIVGPALREGVILDG